jgi:hypothetical protein
LVGLDEERQLGDLILTTDDARCLVRQSHNSTTEGPRRGEPIRTPVNRKLIHMLRLIEILEPMLAQIKQSVSIPGQAMGRLRHQHLASVSRRADPCDTVDVDPNVVAGVDLRNAGMHAHPNRHRSTPRPLLVDERLLCTLSSAERRRGIVERDEQRITRRTKYDPL